MTALPPSLGRTFLLAARELGFFSAARIFVRETAAEYGAALTATAVEGALRG